MSLEQIGLDAKKASRELSKVPTVNKNRALQLMKERLLKRQKEIFEVNQLDIQQAQDAALSEAMIDRLSLQDRLEGICKDIEQVIHLPDPVGERFETKNYSNLNIEKWRTPIGVLGIIYESRPNVTIDISALAIKSGNCAILRGGSETFATNKILTEIIQEALVLAGLPKNAIQYVPSTDRAEVLNMLRLHKQIDLIIPRGGSALHQFCRENSSIPVITGGVGVCHLFVDATANLGKSLPVILNAKTQRPTVCNALDTLLVHEKVAEEFIPQVIELLASHRCKFSLDKESYEIAKRLPFEACFSEAQEPDWDTEWLGLTLGIKIVKDLSEAMNHIFNHSTGHSDGILTEDLESANRFQREVDSAAVYVNATTRFTDGGQLGLGSEVAISTQKLHARGPMGLQELTSYKWVIQGDYAIRQ